MAGITENGEFLLKQLEQKEAGQLTRKMPNLPFANGTYLPAFGDLEIGAQYSTKEVVDMFGEAKIYSETSSDIAMVSTTIDEQGYRNFTFVAGTKWSETELEKGRLATKNGSSVDVVTQRTNFIPRVFDEAIQKFILVGSAKHGVTGFFNNPNVPVTNSSYNPNSGTAQDALDFLLDVMSGSRERTNLVSSVRFLLVPDKLRLKWGTLFLPNTSVSVLEKALAIYGRGTGGTLEGIVSLNECRSDILEAYGRNANGTNKDLVMALPVDPMAARRSFNNRRPTPLEGPTDMVYKRYYLQGTSEVKFDYPKEFEYFNITKMT